MMLLRKEGPATGSDLARRLGVSSGDTSYHLNVLADYGFIEEDKARNHGRKKFWRARHEGLEWSIDTDDAALVEATSVLGLELGTQQSRGLRRWYAETPEWDRRWRAAADSTEQWLELTPDELRALSDEVMAVLERYADRRQRRDGTERAIVLFHAFPEKRDAA